jgi:glycosyltransferase involved in cell wall biosynthesis
MRIAATPAATISRSSNAEPANSQRERKPWPRQNLPSDTTISVGNQVIRGGAHLLILGMNYAPEVTGIGPFTTGIAEHFAKEGHSVTVATTFPHYPAWRVDPRYARGQRLLRRELERGVTVQRTWVYIPTRRSLPQRLLYDSSLAATTAAAVFGPRRANLIICVSPPLQLAVTALLIGRLHRAPVLLHLQDLVPDVALTAGMIREGRIVMAARALERFVYRHVRAISVISHGLRANLLTKGVPEQKLHLLPNWVETGPFEQSPNASAFRGSMGVTPPQTLLLHAGNMGAKQDLASLIDAMALRQMGAVTLALVGDGQDRRALEQKVRNAGMTNVRFAPLQDDFASTLAAADILIVHQLKAVVDSVAPSKLLAYMAAARPVVAVVNDRSEAADVVREAGCGIVVPPAAPQLFAAAIDRLQRDPALRQTMGESGRRYVQLHFEKQAVLESWSALVARVAGVH